MNNRIRKAVFPVAGLGTRNLPATKSVPKEMLPIIDKPIIQYAVEEALSAGIKEMVFIVSPHKSCIKQHFDKSFELEKILEEKKKTKELSSIRSILPHDANCSYVIQEEALGLGHAILCAKPFVKDEPVAVILSDDIIPPEDTLLSDMISLYNELKSPILALQKVPMGEIHRYGVIDGVKESEGVYKVNNLVEKPSKDNAPSDLAIIGRYILTPDIFEVLDKAKPGKGGEIQLTDAIYTLLQSRPVYGFVFEGKRYDAGDKLGYLKATIDFAIKNPDLSGEFKTYLVNVANRMSVAKTSK